MNTRRMLVSAAVAVMLSPAVAAHANVADTKDQGRVAVDVTAISCGTSRPDVDSRAYGTLFSTNGVNTRSGPSTSCSILGRGYLSDRLDYHCYASGQTVNGWSTWTYLRNVTTGKYGWVNDSLLDPNSGTRGSLVACP